MTSLRKGFTTGSCAAAAAKASLYMLLSGTVKADISIITPAHVVYNPQITNITKGNDYVECAVTKDGGDDPDVTTGLNIYAKVSAVKGDELRVIIDGGQGVGRATKNGLKIKIGEAAINEVPRKMIENELTEVAALFDFTGEIRVIISVPQGVEIAKKTFNERLGIEGGISILGTSGIVEPMSEKALLDSIYVELKQKRELMGEDIIIAPGNYGRDFLINHYGYDMDQCVKCSNYIGDTLLMIKELGFRRVLLIGHIGKLVKVSGNILNTHSKYGDHRMELLSKAAAKAGADISTIGEILKCINTTAALEVLEKAQIKNITMNILMDKIINNLRKCVNEMPIIECIMYSENEVLAVSNDAIDLLGSINK